MSPNLSIASLLRNVTAILSEPPGQLLLKPRQLCLFARVISH